MQRRTLLMAGLAAAATVNRNSWSALADEPYPSRSIRLVVPVAAGGLTDIIARSVAAKLGQAWGQSVVVDNRPGGAGVAGTMQVARAKPDGYTILMGTVATLSVNAALIKDLPYDTMRDFAPISMVATTPNILVVHPSIPAKTVAEFVAYAKAHPGTLNFASPGNGSSPHLAGELFKSMAGIDMVHVPYNGTAPAEIDLMSGRIQVMFDPIITAYQNIKAGKIRALGTSLERRSRMLPDVPTIAESGYPGYDVGGWVGLVAPTGTPQPILDRFSKEVAHIVQMPDVQAQMVGMDAVGNTPREFSGFLKSQISNWSSVLARAGFKPQ
ncbi:MAG TPA: tripartite tricarboxylate transporter substrate binding protein [Bordetella sp.]|nr:tripartite tricarboxylate transporter substrate binding protein [Bordetella sp.]